MKTMNPTLFAVLCMLFLAGKAAEKPLSKCYIQNGGKVKDDAGKPEQEGANIIKDEVIFIDTYSPVFS